MQRDVYIFRLVFVVLFLSGSFFLLGKHFYHIQVERHEELHRKACAKYTQSRKKQGTRGCIYDKEGNLLVGNLACRDLLAEPERFTPRIFDVMALLEERLGVDENVLRRRFGRAVDPDLDVVEVVVKRHIAIEKAQELADIFREKNLTKGLRFVESTKRYYPKGELLSNTLGFLNSRQQGVSGIERLMASRLAPSERRVTYEINRLGQQLNSLRRSATHAADGANIYLTVSEPIQQIVETELEKLHKFHAPEASFAVMLDPATGKIMAMAQRPTFNPNRRRRMSSDHWNNQLVTEGFEPGSIMKPLAVAGALDYGVVSLRDRYDCEDGLWYFAGRPLHDAHQFGVLDVRRIIQKSSNIGTAKIGLELGDRRLYQILRRFGFGKAVGIGFRDEAGGILRPPRRWSRLAATRLPIGQGVLATPLQLVQAYGALANGGVMMQPRIIDRIEHPDGTVIETMEPVAKQRAVRPEAASAMTEVLKSVTQAGGTAPAASVQGYETAGKTGTAQKVIDGRYSHDHYVSSFIGYVPAHDPAFVLLVAADDPSKNGYYGSKVAAPTFRRIADKTLRYLQVSPNGRVHTRNAPADGSAGNVAHASASPFSNVH